MNQDKIEEVEKILEEPNISGYDWELGQAILANWKVGLPERICQLFEPKPEETESIIPKVELDSLDAEQRLKDKGWSV